MAMKRLGLLIGTMLVSSAGFGVTVKLDPNGGTLRGSDEFSFGASFGVLPGYDEMPAPVRIGAEFVGWTTLTADEILDPGNVPLVEPGDAAPTAANATLTAVWERFDPTTGEGEWELTEGGMRCRVEARDFCFCLCEPSSVNCSYVLPGRGWVSYKWRVLDADDESKVLYSDSYSPSFCAPYDDETQWQWIRTSDSNDAWYEMSGIAHDWSSNRVAVCSGDPTEFDWGFENQRDRPVIIEIADITWEWAPEDFAVTVTLDPLGGTLETEGPLTCGSQYGELPVPERPESDFVGWTERKWTYYWEDGLTVGNDTWTPLASNVTLYAVWETSAEAAVDPQCTLRDEEAGNWLELDGFDFDVRNTWTTVYDTDEDGDILWDSVRDECSGEIVEWCGKIEPCVECDLLRAYVHGCGTLHVEELSCWSGNLLILVDGVEQAVLQTSLHGQLPFDVEIRQKAGYRVCDEGLLPDDPDYDLHEVRFVVWTECSGYAAGQLGPLTWTPAPSAIEVCFDGCGGTVSGSAQWTFAVGGQYWEFPTATRSKCEFIGWFTEPDGLDQVLPSELVRLSVTNLYSRWKTDLKTAIGGGKLRFATRGDWIGTSDRSHDEDGLSAGTDEVSWGKTNVMTSVVQGPGILSFWWMEGGYDALQPLSYANSGAILSLWVDGRLLVTCCRESKWQHMTLPILGNGNHTVEWKYTPGNIDSDLWLLLSDEGRSDYLTPLTAWQAAAEASKPFGIDVGVRPGAWVDEIGWTPASNVKDLVLWAKGVAEGNAWLPGTLPLIEAAYDAKIAAEPANYEWRILRSLTKLALLGDNENLLAVMKDFGFSPDCQVLGQFFGALDYDDAPLSNEVVDELSAETVPVLESALADLEAIPDGWTGSVVLSPAAYPVDVITYVDLADVTLCQSILKGALAAVAIAESYDLSVDYMNVEMELILAEAGLPMNFEYAVEDHPELMKRVRDAVRLAEGRTLLREALQTYQAFDVLMLARNTSEMHFFEYTEKDAEAQRSARTKVAKMLAALNGTTTVTSEDLGDLKGYCLTNVEQDVTLAPFFQGNVTRRYLPTQIDGNMPVFDSFPNMTFGGLFPGLTKATVAGWLADNGVAADFTPESEYEPEVLYRTFSAAIPDLGVTATEDEIADALSGTVDSAVYENVKDAKSYAEYEKWASKLGNAGVPLKAIKASEHAWLSSALATPELLVKDVMEEDLKVETFEPSAESGKFDFTVSVKDVEVGPEAQKENLKKVFGLEGATTLDGSAFSSDAVDIEFGTPEDGKVKFTATPKVKSAGSFFMKVRVNQ